MDWFQVALHLVTFLAGMIAGIIVVNINEARVYNIRYNKLWKRKP